MAAAIWRVLSRFIESLFINFQSISLRLDRRGKHIPGQRLQAKNPGRYEHVCVVLDHYSWAWGSSLQQLSIVGLMPWESFVLAMVPKWWRKGWRDGGLWWWGAGWRTPVFWAWKEFRPLGRRGVCGEATSFDQGHVRRCVWQDRPPNASPQPPGQGGGHPDQPMLEPVSHSLINEAYIRNRRYIPPFDDSRVV